MFTLLFPKMISSWTCPNPRFENLRYSIFGVPKRQRDGSAQTVGFFPGIDQDPTRMDMVSRSTASTGARTNLQSKSRSLMARIGKSNLKRQIFPTTRKAKISELHLCYLSCSTRSRCIVVSSGSLWDLRISSNIEIRRKFFHECNAKFHYIIMY